VASRFQFLQRADEYHPFSATPLEHHIVLHITLLWFIC
jgi:hypothetical protein